ncbi:uncharacterized protein DSM5745_10993 [Aspergillus mulundensis]|uniref:3beta-hydroxysteroid 3-dehydrogenase n=1 Tax=Aspergillus mulundensis TaxID=1810919 RepID=A0A3D8QCH0_9EURO|nr:Uncharacterized protein DSM5745_10993 [Aspergillus mulundensis]RDW59298.1 Uncharacterized protein DSM5745_10993 [Aspergillus mulundensis]
MPGTILITGATSSLATRVIHLLLTSYSHQDPAPEHENKHEFTLLLTARNPSKLKIKLPELTGNTNISVKVRTLDLSSISSVHTFATEVSADVQSGKTPPLTSIICNASHWDLRKEEEVTDDGYERTFQVNFLAHAVLILRLLGSFKPEAGGRIVLLTCDAHLRWPLKSVLERGRARGLEKYPPGMPDDLDELVTVESQAQCEPQSPEQILEELQEKPKIRKKEKPEFMARGIRRHANSKIAIIMWMYALNRRLEEDIALNTITAIAVNPGTLLNSRQLRVNTSLRLKLLSLFLMTAVRPSLSLLCRLPFVGTKVKAKKTMRTCAGAAGGVVGFALDVRIDSGASAGVSADTGPDSNEVDGDGDSDGDGDGDGGYYTLSIPVKDVGLPDMECLDEERQEALWRKTLQWAGIWNGNTAIRVDI